MITNEISRKRAITVLITVVCIIAADGYIALWGYSWFLEPITGVGINYAHALALAVLVEWFVRTPNQSFVAENLNEFEIYLGKTAARNALAAVAFVFLRFWI